VREFDAQGFEIGCHSMTHPYLSDLSEPELKREIVDAKLPDRNHRRTCH
jgi:peptidoglycan/xylan/chitin deacetylase (PgdA/CDA1 family)